jgi:hypothetical protein
MAKPTETVGRHPIDPVIVQRLSLAASDGKPTVVSRTSCFER